MADDDAGLEALQALLNSAELIVDALLGAGRSRPIEGPLAGMLEALAAARSQRAAPRLIAVDLPTGVDPDSGLADPLTVAPDETVTFAYPKVGLYTQPGAALAGDVQTVDIGIPAELARRPDRRAGRAARREGAAPGAAGAVAQGHVRAGAGGGAGRRRTRGRRSWRRRRRTGRGPGW